MAERAGQVILALQDTTSLNYTNRVQSEGLGPIGTQVDGAQGLHLHSTLALCTDGVPLGFLAAKCWARDPAQFGKKKAHLPIGEKESQRWIDSYRAVSEVQQRLPELTLVSVADREGDIYELFTERVPQGAHLLVRAKTDRALEADPRRLFEAVDAQPVAGMLPVQLPRQHARKARTAQLAIRHATVRLSPPQGKAHLPVVEVQVVHAQEQGAERLIEPIDWWLITTLPVGSFEQAVEKIQWYAQRWNIEVFHRTLKSGCRIEDRRLEEASSLEACLAIDMVVAWRICHLVKLGREVPHADASVYFAEDEWKALVVYSTKNPEPPANAPTLREAIRLVAKLGGFRGRKSDGEPGAGALWIGLQRLDGITTGWRIMQRRDEQRLRQIAQLQRRLDESTEANERLRAQPRSGP